MTRSVLIIGGGVTGLAAAHRLLELRPETGVTVLEQDGRFGGKIFTDQCNDAIIEGGADSFLSAKPRGTGLGRELGLLEREIHPDPANRGAFIFHNGKLESLPEGISGLASMRPSVLLKSPLISPLGKLRILLEAAIPARDDHEDESVASFFGRRVGAEVYNNLFEPLLTGIYAGDGRKLSMESTFAQWRTAEQTHGSLTAAIFAARRERKKTGQSARPRPTFTSYRNGLGELISKLTTNIRNHGGELRTDTSVNTLNAADGQYVVDGTIVDGVVLATPAPVTASLMAPIDRHVSEALASIPMSSTVIVALVLPKSQVRHPLKGSGYIVPVVAKRQVMAMTWMSSKWQDRVPDDQVLIRAFLGRDETGRLLNLDEEALTNIVLNELWEVLGVSAMPLCTRIFRWPDSMPQYTLGHRDRIRTVENRVRDMHGLEIAGNMLYGVGIPDCIASGEQAAESIVSHLNLLDSR